MSNHFFINPLGFIFFMIVFIFKNSVNIVSKIILQFGIYSKAIWPNLHLNKCPYLRKAAYLCLKKAIKTSDSGFVITLYADSQSLASVIKNS
jgi:hypothetical protein